VGVGTAEACAVAGGREAGQSSGARVPFIGRGRVLLHGSFWASRHPFALQRPALPWLSRLCFTTAIDHGPQVTCKFDAHGPLYNCLTAAFKPRAQPATKPAPSKPLKSKRLAV
jgi:hypothetical protein